MKILCPVDPLKCIPFLIGSGRSEAGPRIGGRPPSGIRPAAITQLTKYFLTIPVVEDPALDLSVFLSFDFDQMLEASCKIHGADSGLIQLMIHEPRPREWDSSLSSHLTEHPLVLKEPKIDWLISDEGQKVIHSSHKIGGRPYLDQWRNDLENISAFIDSERLVHILQIGFPTYEDADIAGDWPFGGGMFHILGRPTFDENVWYYFWEV